MRTTVIHDLKSQPPFFEEILARHKTFEIRINDRDFKVGDMLRLKEWDPRTGEFTGRVVVCNVFYVSDAYLPEGWIAMSIGEPF